MPQQQGSSTGEGDRKRKAEQEAEREDPSNGETRKRKASDEAGGEEARANKTLVVEDESGEVSLILKNLTSESPAEAPKDMEGNMAKNWGIRRGIIMDLRKGKWDFSSRENRNKARQWIKENKPSMIVGPEVQVALDTTKGEEKAKEKNKDHQQFMMELIAGQRAAGRMYYHEFLEAPSANTQEARELRSHGENQEVQVGTWETKEGEEGRLMAMTNSTEIAQEMKALTKESRRKVRIGDKSSEESEGAEAAIITGTCKQFLFR